MLLSRRGLRDSNLTNSQLRAYEASLLSKAAQLRFDAEQLDQRLQLALDDLRKGGDYYLAEAISLLISLGGIVTFQWLAVVGGVTALYASVKSRWRNERDPIHRLMSTSAAMRRVRKEAKQIAKAVNDVAAEKRRRMADPALGWP